MPVNLKKGQKVDLRKDDGSSFRHLVVGLGWDEVNAAGRRLIGSNAPDVDCDASALVCTNGYLSDFTDVVYFSNLNHKSGALRHMGDNLTGAGEGDDEQILVDLDVLPPQYDRIIFVVNIYQAAFRHQDFGMVENAYIRIVDADTGNEIFRYNLTEDYPGLTAMVFGELYKRNGAWRFNAIGQGTTDDKISDLAQRFTSK